MSAASPLAGFGLRIRSELPVPGAQASPDAEALPDLTIELGNASLPRSSPHVAQREILPYTLAGDSLLFAMPGVARYRCDAGVTLTVEPQPGADPDELAALLIATALPAALWMRGGLVLHAAGAVLPGQSRAIAFAGPSGWGKSTVLQRLLGCGASVVGDDTLHLREGSNVVTASGLPGLIHHPASAAPGQDAGPRHVLQVPAHRQSRSADLGAIVVAGPEPEPTRLHGAHALAALLRNLHRPLVPTILQLHPRCYPGWRPWSGEFRSSP